MDRYIIAWVVYKEGKTLGVVSLCSDGGYEPRSNKMENSWNFLGYVLALIAIYVGRIAAIAGLVAVSPALDDPGSIG